jgi:Tat protein translocase TatB subunit
MFGIGMPEIILIALIALIVVGPKNLPGLAKSLGKGLSEFRRAADDVTDNLRETIRADDLKKDVDDFKNSLLYGEKKQPDQEAPAPSSSNRTEASSEEPPPPLH